MGDYADNMPCHQCQDIKKALIKSKEYALIPGH